jgi:hypothetical protein
LRGAEAAASRGVGGAEHVSVGAVVDG